MEPLWTTSLRVSCETEEQLRNGDFSLSFAGGLYSMRKGKYSFQFRIEQMKKLAGFLTGSLNYIRTKLHEDKRMFVEANVAGQQAAMYIDSGTVHLRLRTPGTNNCATIEEQDLVRVVGLLSYSSAVPTRVYLPHTEHAEIIMCSAIPLLEHRPAVEAGEEANSAAEEGHRDASDREEVQIAVNSISTGCFPSELISEVSRLNGVQQRSTEVQMTPQAAKTSAKVLATVARLEDSENEPPPKKTTAARNAKPKLGPDGQAVPKRQYNRNAPYKKKQQQEQQTLPVAPVVLPSTVHMDYSHLMPCEPLQHLQQNVLNKRTASCGISAAQLRAGCGPMLGIAEQRGNASEEEDMTDYDML